MFACSLYSIVTAYVYIIIFYECQGIKNCRARNRNIRQILASLRVGDTKLDIPTQFHHVFFMGEKFEVITKY